jgi:hypothetical protein
MHSPRVTDKFTGAIGLNHASGTIHTGEFSFSGAVSAGGNLIPGAWGLVTMVGTGVAITLPGAWIKYGGDDIDYTLGTKNHFQAFVKDDATIFWTNKTV